MRPAFGTQLDNDLFLGMAKIEGSVNRLLDIDKVLTENDIGF